MNSSDNCQNCSSSDQISIAGKNFCANCGTAAASATSTETVVGGAVPNAVTNSFSSTIGMAPSTDAPSSTAVVSTGNDDIVSSLTASLSGKPAEPSNTTPVNTNVSTNPQTEKPASTPWVMDSSAVSSVPSVPAVEPTTTPQPTPVAPPVSSSINKFAPSANITDLRPTTAQTNTPITTQQATNSMPAANQPAVDVMTENQATTNSEPEINSSASELASLDSKDEHVFSDDQFNQLANTGNERPAAVQDLTTKPKSTAPVVVPMDTIRPVATPTPAVTAPQAPQSVPSQQPTMVSQPTTQPLLNPDAINSATPSSSVTTPGVIEPQSTIPANTTDTTSGIPGLVDEPMLVPKKKSSFGKKSAKAATVTLTMAGLLLLGAYVWQVNYPNLALKVASSKAGINATIPGYLPNGWQVSNNISSAPGTISYQIGSADGKASATVNQSKTDWDSQALAENYVSNKSDKYLSLQAAGLTIYVYGNQASWVNNGTWYRIEGDNTNLTQDQLIRMATSL